MHHVEISFLAINCLGHEYNYKGQENWHTMEAHLGLLLDEHDFADGVALLSSRYVDIKDKTSRLVDEAARVGLKINARRSKVMRINTRNDQGIKVNDERVDE